MRDYYTIRDGVKVPVAELPTADLEIWLANPSIINNRGDNGATTEAILERMRIELIARKIGAR